MLQLREMTSNQSKTSSVQCGRGNRRWQNGGEEPLPSGVFKFIREAGVKENTARWWKEMAWQARVLALGSLFHPPLTLLATV